MTRSSLFGAALSLAVLAAILPYESDFLKGQHPRSPGERVPESRAQLRTAILAGSGPSNTPVEAGPEVLCAYEMFLKRALRDGNELSEGNAPAGRVMDRGLAASVAANELRGLPQDERVVALDYWDSHDDIVSGVCGQTTSARILALGKMRESNSIGAGADVFVAYLLKDREPNVVLEALRTVRSKGLKSRVILDEMLRALERSIGDGGHAFPVSWVDERSVYGLTCRAIADTRDRRAAVVAVRLIGGDAGKGAATCFGLGEIVVGCGDRTLVGELSTLIPNKTMLLRAEWPIVYETTTGDVALYCAIRLAGQDPSEYGFSRDDERLGLGRYGFATQGKRESAQAKFLGWWKQYGVPK